MRKLTASTALSVAFGMLLTGCGSAKELDSPAQPAQNVAATEGPSSQAPAETAAEQEDQMLSLEDTCAEFNQLMMDHLAELEDGESWFLGVRGALLELSNRSPADVSGALTAIASASEEELSGTELDDEGDLLWRTCHTEAYSMNPETPWDPVPAEKVAYFDLGEALLEDADGYTGLLSGGIEVPEFEANPENAKPGFVDLERADPTHTLSFRNTTAQREAPALMMIQVSIYYSVESLVCKTYMNRSDKRARFGEVLYGPEYCVFPSNFLAAGDTGMAEWTVGPDQTIGYADAREYISADVFNAHRLVGVPEGEAESLLAALNEPLGAFVTKWGGEDSYSPKNPPCELPTDLTTSSGSPAETIDEPAAALLMAAGPFCE